MARDEDRTPLRRVVGASLIGTTIEWYDFFLYGSAAALVFNRLFFPEYDPLTGTLLAFATYALGFVARPVGGPARASTVCSASGAPRGSCWRAAGCREVGQHVTLTVRH